MKEKKIIERLMLELECKQCSECDALPAIDDDAINFIVQLEKTGYKRFPEYGQQSDQDKREVQELLNMEI